MKYKIKTWRVSLKKKYYQLNFYTGQAKVYSQPISFGKNLWITQIH